MIGTIAGLILQVSAIALMAGGIVVNHLAASYDTALAVPLFNAIAIILASLGLTSVAVAYRQNRDRRLTRCAAVTGAICVIALIAVFPLSNTGALSAVQ